MVQTSVDICNNSSADAEMLFRRGEGVLLQTRPVGQTKFRHFKSRVGSLDPQSPHWNRACNCL